MKQMRMEWLLKARKEKEKGNKIHMTIIKQEIMEKPSTKTGGNIKKQKMRIMSILISKLANKIKVLSIKMLTTLIQIIKMFRTLITPITTLLPSKIHKFTINKPKLKTIKDMKIIRLNQEMMDSNKNQTMVIKIM